MQKPGLVSIFICKYQQKRRFIIFFPLSNIKNVYIWRTIGRTIYIPRFKNRRRVVEQSRQQ